MPHEPVLPLTDEGDLFVKEIMDAEVGEVSFVDVPATDRPFVLFKRTDGTGEFKHGEEEKSVAQKPARAKGDKLDSCVEQVMAEGKDKDAAYAICQASLSDEEKEKVGPPPPPPQQPGPPQPEAVQVPETPAAVAVNDVMTKCLEMGLDEESANQVVQLIRTNYGDPNQPDTILLPAGVTIEQMIQAAMEVVQGNAANAAQQPGAMQGGGSQAPVPPVPGKSRLRFTGTNVWSALFYKFIGREAPGEEVSELKIEDLTKAFTVAQAKTNEQMVGLVDRLMKESDRRNDQMMRLFAGALGIEVPEQKPEAEEVIEPVEAPEVAEPVAVGKSAKADRLAQIEAWARANGWQPEEEEETEEEVVETVVQPQKRVVARKSVDPGRVRTRGMVRSSILGIEIPAADRQALKGR